jgi:hypothetical protein
LPHFRRANSGVETAEVLAQVVELLLDRGQCFGEPGQPIDVDPYLPCHGP